MKKIYKMTIFLFVISMFIATASAAPSKPVLKNDPMNGQTLPFYEVWLRWNDVPNESHYTMTIRDLGYEGRLGDAGALIYNQQYVSQNSTYFIVPTSKLTRGHYYRWCLNSVDSNGNRTIADAHIFAIEEHNPDRHFKTYNGVAVTARSNVVEYFVYANTSAYDSILNQAAQNWNGIANVSLIRTATPSDGQYEIGIYESPSPADPTIVGESNLTFGNTVLNHVNYILQYAEIHAYKDNVDMYHDSNTFLIKDKQTYHLANAMHEVGHALLLNHTWYDNSLPNPYDISKTLSICGSNTVPLIMNSGAQLGGGLNVVDRDHLRIKWGS